MNQNLELNTGSVHETVEKGRLHSYEFVVDEGRHRCVAVLEGAAGQLKVTENRAVIRPEHRATKEAEPVMAARREGLRHVIVDAEGPASFYVNVTPDRDGEIQLYVTEFPLDAPKSLWGKLRQPLDGEMQLHTQEFSPPGSPWGNEKQSPFFKNAADYIHLGVDYVAAPGTPVRAVAPGKVVKVGDSGEGWGHHVVVEHKIGKQIFTVVYEHLQKQGRPNVGDDVKAGDKMGLIWPMEVEGEVPHLHLCGHLGPFKPTHTETDIRSTAGAAPRKRLAADRSYFNMDDRRIYKKPVLDRVREAVGDAVAWARRKLLSLLPRS